MRRNMSSKVKNMIIGYCIGLALYRNGFHHIDLFCKDIVSASLVRVDIAQSK